MFLKNFDLVEKDLFCFSLVGPINLEILKGHTENFLAKIIGASLSKLHFNVLNASLSSVLMVRHIVNTLVFVE